MKRLKRDTTVVGAGESPARGPGVKISSKGRLAVMALMRLALQQKGRGRPPTAESIAREQGISLSHMESVLATLRRAGFILSVRGPGGGYLLARPAEEISVAEILDVADPPVPAEAGELSAALGLWHVLGGRLHAFLGGITLAEAVDRNADAEPWSQESPKRRASGGR